MASEGYSKPVTYKEIAAHLEKNEKKRYTRAYIYRCLSELEEDEFIFVVDTVQHPKQFKVSEAGIVRALEKKRKKILSELLTKRQDITTKRNLLTGIEPREVSIFLYNQLAGSDIIQQSMIIEGTENVRSTIIREFGEASKPGDEIRVIAPASVLDGGLEKAGITEMSLLARARDGVKIISVLIPVEGKQSFTADLISNYIQHTGDAFTKLASTGNILFRIAKKNYKTYRMVSLNSEKMLLYLTHAAESDMAALVLRKDNPGLIDDAVATFDRIYNESIGIAE